MCLIEFSKTIGTEVITFSLGTFSAANELQIDILYEQGKWNQ